MPKELSELTNEELLNWLNSKGSPPSVEESSELVRRGIIYDWYDANPPYQEPSRVIYLDQRRRKR